MIDDPDYAAAVEDKLLEAGQDPHEPVTIKMTIIAKAKPTTPADRVVHKAARRYTDSLLLGGEGVDKDKAYSQMMAEIRAGLDDLKKGAN